MKTLTHSDGRSPYQWQKSELRRDWLWQFGLWSIALTLFSLDLGQLPLLDTREGTLAELAHNLSVMLGDRLPWSGLPLDPNTPVLHNPLVPSLVALAYHWGGASVWMTRLPGAILASFSIPLIYGMGREIFPARLPAILSALLHLTFLPVIREGRLATENGALLCFGCLLILCGLRSRRDLRWSLGIGLSGSALFLAELQTGLLMMLLLGIFLAWDTPRLWGSLYFWLGSLLGLLPAITWYGWQLSNKGMGISSIVSGQFSPLWWQGTLPLLPFLPGLVFSLSGLYRAWQSRLWGWAKLIIVWVAIAAIALVWGSHTGMPLLLFPAFALAGGVELAEVRGLPGDLAYPRYWRTGLCFFILAIALRGTLWVVIYDPLTAASFWQVAIISTSQLFTLIVTLRLIYRRDPQFIYIFFWGLYVFSLLFFISPYWTSLI